MRPDRKALDAETRVVLGDALEIKIRPMPRLHIFGAGLGLLNLRRVELQNEPIQIGVIGRIEVGGVFKPGIREHEIGLDPHAIAERMGKIRTGGSLVIGGGGKEVIPTFQGFLHAIAAGGLACLGE